MTLAQTRQEYQRYILEGMARMLWVQAYATWADDQRECRWCGALLSRKDSNAWTDENGGVECEESDDYRNHEPDDGSGPERAGPGEDWLDVAPKTPAAAVLAAQELATLYIAGEGLKLPDLFELAVTVDRGEFQFDDPDTLDELAKNDEATLADLALEFGQDLANMALGTGSWFDNHKQKSGTAVFDPKIPSFEIHYDGDTLTWSGSEGTARASSQQAARYEDGEVLMGEKLGSLTILNENDRAWTKHVYVLAIGAYGSSKFVVFANSLQDAVDEVIDWAVDHAPGLLADDQAKEAYDEAIADGKSEDEAHEIAEMDLTSGGNAGNYIRSDEWHMLAEDPSDEQLLELAGFDPVRANPSRKSPREISEKVTMPNGKEATIYVESTRSGTVSARLVLSNGNVLPISLGKETHLLSEGMVLAKRFLAGVYGRSNPPACRKNPDGDPSAHDRLDVAMDLADAGDVRWSREVEVIRGEIEAGSVAPGAMAAINTRSRWRVDAHQQLDKAITSARLGQPWTNYFENARNVLKSRAGRHDE